MLPPAALRAMRAALDWSMRDTAREAGISLATVLKVESGHEVSPRTEQRLRAAFKARGVKSWPEQAGVNVHIQNVPPSAPTSVPEELKLLPYVTVRSLSGGRHKVLFEVPSRLRPDAWPPTRPLPITYQRRGDLTDPAEVAAIKKDAERLFGQLERLRAGVASAPRQPSTPCRPVRSGGF